MKAKKEKEQKKLIDRQLNQAFFQTEDAACPTECTGLAYRPARNQEEEESYNEIYHFLPPKETKTDQEEGVAKLSN